jgi:hypothetical protein
MVAELVEIQESYLLDTYEQGVELSSEQVVDLVMSACITILMSITVEGKEPAMLMMLSETLQQASEGVEAMSIDDDRIVHLH